MLQFSSVQLLSCVWLFATPWIAALQASLSITTPGVYSNSYPSSWWCHPAISSSVVPFSSCPQFLPVSGSFPMSQLFTWGGQSTGVSASASVLPTNTEDWSPLGWTGWISLQSKGLSRVFSNTTVQRHQFFCMFSKSLIQFSVDGKGCVPSLLFDLRPTYGGGSEDNGNLLPKAPRMHCCSQCPQSGSRPPPTHASTKDNWTLTGKSGSVSCGVTAPFLQVLVHTRYSLDPPRICFPSPV